MGITWGIKSGKMGRMGLGICIVMGRFENRWIPKQGWRGGAAVYRSAITSFGHYTQTRLGQGGRGAVHTKVTMVCHN